MWHTNLATLKFTCGEKDYCEMFAEKIQLLDKAADLLL